MYHIVGDFKSWPERSLEINQPIRHLDQYCFHVISVDKNMSPIPYYYNINEIKKDVFIWPLPTYLPKNFEVILTRLQIGHTQINHGHLISKYEPFPPAPTCPSCGTKSFDQTHNNGMSFVHRIQNKHKTSKRSIGISV